MRNAKTHAAGSCAFCDAGFMRSVDPQAARRQFNMSLGLIAALGLAILTSALTLRIHPAPAARHVARATIQAPQMMPVRQAVFGLLQQPGG